MITTFRQRQARAATNSDRKRTYFVHIPKTAGITFKTFLENNFALGDSLVIDEVEARTLSPRELNQYHLWSGHYASEILEQLTPRPEVMIMLVRDPVERFRSWTAHGRRSQHPEYRALCEGRTDMEILADNPHCDAFQSYWLARAVRDGADRKVVPDADELPALLNQITLVGLTEQLDRFMQLVSFQMGWPAPPLGWHINRRPDAASVSTHDDAELREQESTMRSLLALDVDLYARVELRFWTAYALMLSVIHPDRLAFTVDTAATVSIDVAQTWLRRFERERRASAATTPVTRIDSAGDQPIAGEGWWWRECPAQDAYRWTTNCADLSLEPLAEGTYAMTLEVMGAADWTVWESVRLEVNGRTVPAVRERFGPADAGRVRLRLHAHLTPDIVSAQHGRTDIVVHVPTLAPVPSGADVLESLDTVRRDERRVGIALHRVRIEPAAPEVKPSIALRRAS